MIGPYWVQTIGGGAVDLVNPAPEQIDFVAMATSLSRLPRFVGQTEKFAYSVAQHLINGTEAILRAGYSHAHAAAFLLHDGHEYVIGDDASPKLGALVALAQLHEDDIHAGEIIRRARTRLASNLDRAIYEAAGITWPLPHHIAHVVKEYDVRLLCTERDALMAKPPYRWVEAVERALPLDGVDLTEREPKQVQYHWQSLLANMCGDVYFVNARPGQNLL